MIRNFFAKHEKSVSVIAVLVAVLVFSAICFTQIGRWSIWFDESFTHFLVKFNFLDIAKWTASDVHPPLFYWLLKLWSLIFGSSDVALRAFSTLCGAGAIAMGFVVSRKLFGKKAGYLALPLLALSPMLLRYGIEMRMYAFVVFLVFLQLFILIKIREKSTRLRWVLYGFLLAIGAWTQYFAVFSGVAQVIWLYVSARADLGEKKLFSRKIWRKFITGSEQKSQKIKDIIFAKNGNLLQAVLVAFIVFLPWIPFVLIQFLTVATSGFWIPPVNFATIPDLISSVFFFETAANLTGWFSIIMIAVIALIFAQARKAFSANPKKDFRESFNLVLFGVIIPPAILLLISLPPMRSYFIDRYVLASVAMVPVLIAAIISVSRKNTKNVLGIALYILAISSSIFGVLSLFHYGNYNRYSGDISMSKFMMKQVQEKTGANKIPVVADSAWSFFDADTYATNENPVYFLDSQVDNYYYGSEKMLAGSQEEIADLKEFFAKNNSESFWYVSSTGSAENLPGELSDFRGKITKIDEINVNAPNGWKGSSQAVLYKIQH